MAVSNVITGADIHVTAWDESTWSTKPGVPTYQFLPLTDYGIKQVSEHRTNRPYFGQFGRKHGRRHKFAASGSMGGPLIAYHKNSESIAQFVLDWAFGGETNNVPPSIGLERAEGPNTANEQVNGLICNTFALTGSEDQGNVTWTADAMGRNTETVATAQTVPDDLDGFVDIEFPDCTLTIDSTGTEFSSFTLNRNNNLDAKWMANRTPSIIYRTDRLTTLSLELVKETAAYDVIRRTLTAETELDITLVLKGLHNGSGANDYTTIDIDMVRCQLIDPDDAYAIEAGVMTTLNLICLKPDTTAADIAFTYGTEAA